MDFRTAKIIGNLPLVTIGLSSYNYARYIRVAMDSILEQTYSNIELIIVDDCSNDNSVEIIQEWIKINDIKCDFIKHKENRGITRTSNEIVKLAKGKYITLFASDDIMLPERIERQVAILEKAGKDYGMCYANAAIMNEAGDHIGLYSSDMKIFEGDVLHQYVFGKLSFATPSCLIRMSVYNKVGLYDERTLIEDYNFWLRLMACYKVKYCNYSCLVYRIKQSSAVHNQLRKNNSERYCRDRILSNQQALKFISDKEIKLHLKLKIEQYLKTLAIHNADSFKSIFIFLLKSGYVFMPVKVFCIKQFLDFRRMFACI